MAVTTNVALCPAVDVTLDGSMVIFGATAAAFTVNCKFALPVPPLFVALSVAVQVPADPGTPETRPVEVFTKRSEGNPLAPKLVGLLLAVI